MTTDLQSQSTELSLCKCSWAVVFTYQVDRSFICLPSANKKKYICVFVTSNLINFVIDCLYGAAGANMSAYYKPPGLDFRIEQSVTISLRKSTVTTRKLEYIRLTSIGSPPITMYWTELSKVLYFCPYPFGDIKDVILRNFIWNELMDNFLCW